MLGTTLIQQGVPNEWLNRLNNIKNPFQAQMKMAKVEAIKRTKYLRAELVELHKKEKEFNDQPNNEKKKNVYLWIFRFLKQVSKYFVFKGKINY